MMPRWFPIAALFHVLCHATDDVDTCGADQQQRGLCQEKRPVAMPALAKESQLLQLRQNSSGQESGRHRGGVPGEFSCHGMPDVKESCSTDGCKVLADRMTHKTCNDYCARDGRTCEAAWEEVNNDCKVNQNVNLACDQSYGDTSDLLCQCSKLSSVEDSGEKRADPKTLDLVWSDEFDGTSVDSSKWGSVNKGGGFGNQEKQYYREENAKVGNGKLTITAKCERYKGHSFTSAKLVTKGRVSWGPGHRIDVKARAPTGKGSWPAIWMLPDHENYGRWPASGEIDIMEAVGCTSGKIYGTVHTDAYNHMKNTEKSNKFKTDVDGWHEYSIEWTADDIRWYIDDKLFHRFAPSSHSYDKWPYSHHFHLILNVAVGGSWGGFCLKPNGRPPSCSNEEEFRNEQTMQVDYARVYKLP